MDRQISARRPNPKLIKKEKRKKKKKRKRELVFSWIWPFQWTIE